MEAGDRVAVEVFQSCRSCHVCRSGAYRRCERHGLADMYGFMAVDRPPGLWGGYASHQYLAPDSMLIPVPEGLDPVTATLFNPLGAGIRWGVTMPGTTAGDVVAVLGPASEVCRRSSPPGRSEHRRVVTGPGARGPGPSELARCPAPTSPSTCQDDPVEALRDATGALADVVVDVTAKAPQALRHAVGLARPGGTVVIAGTRGNTGEGLGPVVDAARLADLVVFKELRVLGALGVDATAYGAALDLLASGRYPFADLPAWCAGLSDVDALLRSMAGLDAEPPRSTES